MKAAKRERTPTKMTRRKFLRLSFITALTVCSVDAVAVEPYWIEVTRHDVRLKRLPRELDGFTIAQLSDLHRSLVVPDRLLRRAVEMTNDLKPDLVVATGDFVSRRASNAGPCAEILSKLTPRLGTYAVLGNHDHWTDAKVVRSHIERRGIPVLDNASRRITPGLTLLGIDDLWAGHPDFSRAWSQADPEDAHVVLSHNPMAVSMVRSTECLMISGHTHGGHVNLPVVPYRALSYFRGWKYMRGWYQIGNAALYVNRGIGMLPIRFMCRPEISLFTLRVES